MTGLTQRFTTMGWSRSIAAVGVFGFLVGCSGHVYTVPTPKLDPKKNRYEGVLAYSPVNFMEISWTTAVLEKETNKVLRTSTGTTPQTKCIPRLQFKQVVRGDYDSPYQIFYDPGFLEKYNFKVELDQGVLKSVGVDSSPDRGETFKNLATAAGEAAKAVKGAFVPDEFPCTHEPVLKFIEKSAKVCPDGKCDFEPYMPKP
ncbi:MAG: hypothetical protein ABI604_11470 [Nitrospirota bacterium]